MRQNSDLSATDAGPIAAGSNCSPMDKSVRPVVWACIAVFNRIAYTRKCLELLRAQTWPGVVAVVVDDGSSDGTSAMIKADFPETVLTHGDGSLFWAGAMHLGIEEILRRCAPGDYILLLNDDLIFEPSMVERLVAASRRNPKSLIQAVESCVSDRDLIWQGGTRLNWWTARHERLNHHRRISEFPREHMERADYLTGRGVLVPIEVFKVAGNIVPDYKQGGDPEFSRRAAKFGYSLLVAYDVSVFSYSKGDNMNEAERYSPRDIVKYYFSVRSGFRISNRWRDAILMTNWWFQAPVFFVFDMIRVTGHFLKRLRLRAGVAI